MSRPRLIWKTKGEGISRLRLMKPCEGKRRANELTLSRLRPTSSDGRKLRLKESMSRSVLMSRIRVNGAAISRPRLNWMEDICRLRLKETGMSRPRLNGDEEVSQPRVKDRAISRLRLKKKDPGRATRVENKQGISRLRLKRRDESLKTEAWDLPPS